MTLLVACLSFPSFNFSFYHLVKILFFKNSVIHTEKSAASSFLGLELFWNNENLTFAESCNLPC